MGATGSTLGTTQKVRGRDEVVALAGWKEPWRTGVRLGPRAGDGAYWPVALRAPDHCVPSDPSIDRDRAGRQGQTHSKGPARHSKACGSSRPCPIFPSPWPFFRLPPPSGTCSSPSSHQRPAAISASASPSSVLVPSRAELLCAAPPLSFDRFLSTHSSAVSFLAGSGSGKDTPCRRPGRN